MRRWTPATAILVLLLLLLLRFLNRGGEWSAAPSSMPPSGPAQSGEYSVERVVDGDTLVLMGGDRVRLWGIDAPESVKPNSPVEPFGPEASQAVRDYIQSVAGRIRLETENQRDKYGRLLGVVWAADICINEALVERGLARVAREYACPRELKARLLAAEDRARKARRGIWGAGDALPP